MQNISLAHSHYETVDNKIKTEKAMSKEKPQTRI